MRSISSVYSLSPFLGDFDYDWEMTQLKSLGSHGSSNPHLLQLYKL